MCPGNLKRSFVLSLRLQWWDFYSKALVPIDFELRTDVLLIPFPRLQLRVFCSWMKSMPLHQREKQPLKTWKEGLFPSCFLAWMVCSWTPWKQILCFSQLTVSSAISDLSSKSSSHVLVIGATNRPDSIDPALRRAGRFDREISMGIPNESARQRWAFLTYSDVFRTGIRFLKICYSVFRILEVLCRLLRVTSDFDFPKLAQMTPGYVGADLMALVREAAITAVNR